MKEPSGNEIPSFALQTFRSIESSSKFITGEITPQLGEYSASEAFAMVTGVVSASTAVAK
jgi:hypothetical protein